MSVIVPGTPVSRTITINEAAQRLGISRHSAYEAARRGEIPTLKIGRLILVPEAAFERLLDVPVAPRAASRSIASETTNPAHVARKLLRLPEATSETA